MDGIGWIVLWVISIVLGLLALAAPLAAGFVAVLVLSWALIVIGVVHGASAFHRHRARSRAVHLALGFLYVLTGVYLLLAPGAALLSLTLVLAVVFVTAGVLRLLGWWRHRGESGAGWLAFDGGISVILGLWIGSGWPHSALWAPGTLLGAILLVNGISGLMFTLALRRSARMRM